MRTIGFLILLMFILAGCRSNPFGPQAVIDWVDFVKWNGKNYDGIYSGVLSDQKYIGKKIGEVKFKVADNVTNPSYKIKNGDAAFLGKGTGIYEVKGYPSLLAAKKQDDINGYRVYYSHDDQKYNWRYEDMPIQKVEQVEFYQTSGNKLIAKITDIGGVRSILSILDSGKSASNFQPNGDSTIYYMVFYTDGPVAYKYNLFNDGQIYYWYPNDTEILSNEIARYITNN